VTSKALRDCPNLSAPTATNSEVVISSPYVGRTEHKMQRNAVLLHIALPFYCTYALHLLHSSLDVACLAWPRTTLRQIRTYEDGPDGRYFILSRGLP
jgi:hypothetical protein